MERLSMAMVFATIVGLMCSFKSERGSASDDEYNEFIEWLSEKRHNQIIEYLGKNNSLTESIKAFLAENNEIVLNKLNVIDEILSRIASRIDGFSEIVAVIKPHLELSEQCVSLLKQLVESGASSFLEVSDRRRKYLQFHHGGSGKLHIDEPRFLEDDLNVLMEYEFLRLDHIGSGSRVFHLTRQAEKFIRIV